MQATSDGGVELRQDPRQATHAAQVATYFTGRSPERLLLNLGQAAQALGVSERTFHELRRQALVPEPIKLGERALRWDRDELLSYIRQHAPRGRGEVPTHLANPEVTAKRKATMQAKRAAAERLEA